MAKIVESALRMKCSFCGGGRYRLIELKDERLCCTSCLDELVGDPIPRQAIRWFAGEMEKVLREVFSRGWREMSWEACCEAMTQSGAGGYAAEGTLCLIEADLARLQEKEARDEEE